MIDLAPPLLILPSHYEARTPAIIRLETDPARHFPQLRSTGPDKAMLPGMIPVIAGGVPYSMTFVSAARDSVDRVSYSYAGLSLGTAHPLRYMLIVTICSGSAGSNVCTALTLDSVSFTKIHEKGGSNTSSYSYWIGAWPSGTTGTVAMTFGSLQAFSSVGVFRMINPPRLIPFAVAATTVTNSKTVDVPAGGYIVGTGYSATNTNQVWSGITEVDDANVGSGRTSYASSYFAAAVTGQAASATGASTIGLISI